MSAYSLVLNSGPAGHTAIEDAVDQILGLRSPVLFGEPRWLADDEAVDIPFAANADLARLIVDAVRAEIGGLPLDINLVADAGRRKRLLIADMDSTMIQQECIDEMADVLGLKPKIAAITERAMRGELPFEAALRERLGLLAGITEAQLEAVYRDRITLMPGARILIATMRANGAFTALVSGGFTFFTSRVAKAIGFETNRANTLAVANGQLTGRVVEPILGREAKRAMLDALCAERKLDAQAALAVGDGANDLDMIRAAGLGVAYRAKPVVSAEAHASITQGDLTALLYLQGYAKAEFVAA